MRRRGRRDTGALDILAEIGCDVAQGYLVSHPLPADEATAWLRTHLHAATPLELATPADLTVGPVAVDR